MLGRYEQWDAHRRRALGMDQVFTHDLAIEEGLRSGQQEPLRQYIEACLKHWNPASGPSIKEYVVGSNRTLFKWRFRRQCAKRRHIAAARQELLRWANMELEEECRKKAQSARSESEGREEEGPPAAYESTPHAPQCGYLSVAYGKKQKCGTRLRAHRHQKQNDARLQPVLSAFGGGQPGEGIRPPLTRNSVPMVHRSFCVISWSTRHTRANVARGAEEQCATRQPRNEKSVSGRRASETSSTREKRRKGKGMRRSSKTRRNAQTGAFHHDDRQ